MTAQSVDKARTPGRPTPRLVRRAKEHNARIMEDVRKAREDAERAANEQRWQIQETLERKKRLRRTLERREVLARQGIDVDNRTKNIGRVFRLENAYVESLAGFAERVAAHTEEVLGPNVKVRLTIPQLSNKESIGQEFWLTPEEEARLRYKAFIAPLAEVEIVGLRSAPTDPLVEALTFPCLVGFDLGRIVSEAWMRGSRVFGRGVKLRINGLFPIAPEGTTGLEIWNAAFDQGEDVIEEAEAALPEVELCWGGTAQAARNVTVEVVQ